MASFFQAEEFAAVLPRDASMACSPTPSLIVSLPSPTSRSYVLSGYPHKTYEIRQRAVIDQPGALVRDYQEEYASIQGWRDAVVGGQVNGVSNRPAAARLSRPISLTWSFRRRRRVGHGSPGNSPGTLRYAALSSWGYVLMFTSRSLLCHHMIVGDATLEVTWQSASGTTT